VAEEDDEGTGDGDAASFAGTAGQEPSPIRMKPQSRLPDTRDELPPSFPATSPEPSAHTSTTQHEGLADVRATEIVQPSGRPDVPLHTDPSCSPPPQSTVPPPMALHRASRSGSQPISPPTVRPTSPVPQSQSRSLTIRGSKVEICDSGITMGNLLRPLFESLKVMGFKPIRIGARAHFLLGSSPGLCPYKWMNLAPIDPNPTTSPLIELFRTDLTTMACLASILPSSWADPFGATPI